MMKNSKLAIYLCHTILTCYSTTILFVIIVGLVTYNAECYSNREFIIHSYFPIDVKKSPIYEIICILHILVCIFACSYHCVLETLLTVSVLHSQTKAFSVCREFSKLIKLCRTDSSKNDIIIAKQKLIKRHLNFIAFTGFIQDIYSYVAFIHLFLITILNCVTGLLFINKSTIDADKNSILFIVIPFCFTCIWAILIYCIAGEFLTSQGTFIFKTLCKCPWYIFKPLDAKILIFMINRSRLPIRITVGHFGNLSLIYFTQIIKTSVSYISVVRATSQ